MIFFYYNRRVDKRCASVRSLCAAHRQGVKLPQMSVRNAHRMRTASVCALRTDVGEHAHRMRTECAQHRMSVRNGCAHCAQHIVVVRMRTECAQPLYAVRILCAFCAHSVRIP